jgi:hypothetical protein
MWASVAPGQTSGGLYVCVSNAYGESFYGGAAIYWAASVTPPPSAAEFAAAARLAVESYLVAPEIGVWPGDLVTVDPEAMGLVGAPTWFWAKDPGPGIGDALTLTSSVRGYTLRATARLAQTVWDTGDGGQVVCGLGTAPVEVHEPLRSPSGCDYVYAHRGDYWITATTYVRVDWTGSYRSGSFTLTVTRSGLYHVGEVQVLVTGG